MNNYISFFYPSVNLQEFISNYYIAEFSELSSGRSFEQRHLSNGCVEMFIGFKNTWCCFFDCKGEKFYTDSGIIGAHDLERNNSYHPEKDIKKSLKFIAINFRQKGFYSIFKIPGSEIHNDCFRGNEILGNDLELIQEQLENAKTNRDRIQYIEDYLIRKYLENRNKHYNISQGFNIAKYLNEKNGNVRLKELEAEFGISDRTLQRKFNAANGYSIKEYRKIIRFYNLLNDISHQSDISWSDMVLKYGYYDQSHMINEFHKATGLSPSVMCRELNKSIFKLHNHLVKINSSGFQETMAKGCKSYLSPNHNDLNASGMHD